MQGLHWLFNQNGCNQIEIVIKDCSAQLKATNRGPNKYPDLPIDIPNYLDTHVTNSENALDILNSLEFYKIFRYCLLIHYYMSWYSDINVTVNCPENNCATLV